MPENQLRAPGVLEPFDKAYELAQICPHVLEKTEHWRCRKYGIFISMAAHLWATKGKNQNHIALPILYIDKILKRSQTTIWNYRKRAKREGYLIEIASHNNQLTRGNKFQGTTRFKFDLSKTPEITKYHMLKNLDLLSTVST